MLKKVHQVNEGLKPKMQTSREHQVCISVEIAVGIAFAIWGKAKGMTGKRIAQEGKNCWRRAGASRVRFIVDAEEYFAAFASAAANARQQIIIVGWDLHSKTVLRRDKNTGAPIDRLEDFLDRLAGQNDHLRIHLLQWDFAMIYVLERELLPLFQLGWRNNRRIQHRLDDKHPTGASHHQKIVVIDDSLAFIGGLDLTEERWDTREHLLDDGRRTGPDGNPYAPFHDVQVALEGEAAQWLGNLARERWYRAAGETLPSPGADRSPWPESWQPDLQNVHAAIARTSPQWGDQAEIREVEQLFLDAIAAAEDCIYLENQYITSHRIADALSERLQEADPPRVVLITRFTSGNWMEAATLDVLRARVINRLRRADHAGRLRVFYPVTLANNREVKKVIHSKVSIFDDSMLRIGSANLSSRSMGLDTECDVAFESEGDPVVSAAIRDFRNDLLAEHLQVEKKQLQEAIDKEGGLIEALDSLSGRYLRPLDESVEDWLNAVIPENELIDPEKPIEAEELLKRVLTENRGETGRKPVLRLVAIGLLLLAITVAWRWTPLNQWLEPDKLAALTAPLTGSSLGPAYILAAFVLGGLLMVPVTVLILATALVFEPWKAFACSLGGILASAAATYALGSHLWRKTVNRIAGKRITRINNYLEQRGLLTMVLLRNVPVAPFSVINMVAGSSGIRFRDYLIGTLLGMAPGALALTVFTDRVKEIVRNPDIHSVLTAAGVLVLIATAAFLVGHFAPGGGRMGKP